ncbi:MAG: ATP-binding protein [Magnetospirillum sp.]|nr:ATP-binding protein [Magnetospirillum sp.]
MTSEPNAGNTVAPLRNVSLLSELVVRIRDRPPGLPGMGCFHGPSGFGKSFAAMYSANKHRSYHVQVKSVWTRKKLVTAILHEMGVNAAKTIPDMVDQIGEELSLSGRPLLVDEADILVKKGGMIEVIRDLYESSQGTVILIGEENLPHALRQWERLHGRMLDWVPAQPAALQDAKHLARLYAPGISLADDLMDALVQAAAGSVRRICVNLDRVRERAEMAGVSTFGLGDWNATGAAFFTGQPPARRAL